MMTKREIMDNRLDTNGRGYRQGVSCVIIDENNKFQWLSKVTITECNWQDTPTTALFFQNSIDVKDCVDKMDSKHFNSIKRKDNFVYAVEVFFNPYTSTKYYYEIKRKYYKF